MRRVEFHPEAYVEAEDARSWYEAKWPGLGMAFIDAVQRAVDAVRDSPGRWPPYEYGSRRFFLRRFPFSLIYRHDGTKIQATAGRTMSSIAVFAGIDSQHVDDACFCVYFIEETITPDSVPPRFGLVVLQPLDVFSKMGIFPELRINVLPKFFGDPFALSLEIL